MSGNATIYVLEFRIAPRRLKCSRYRICSAVVNFGVRVKLPIVDMSSNGERVYRDGSKTEGSSVPQDPEMQTSSLRGPDHTLTLQIGDDPDAMAKAELSGGTYRGDEALWGLPTSA
jgi:hypothetical protein